MKRELRGLSLGETLTESFSIYTENFVPLFGISAGLSLVSSLLAGQIGSGGSGLILGSLPSLGVSLLIMSFLPGFMIDFISRIYLGETASFGWSVRSVGSRLGGLILVRLLSALIIAGPIAVVVIPAAILVGAMNAAAGILGFLSILVVIFIALATLRLAFSTAAFVAEGLKPVAAIRRSFSLTKGYRPRIFGYYLVAGLIAMVPQYIVVFVLQRLPMGYAAYTIVTAVVSGLLAPFMYGVLILLYFTVRIEKEGFDLEYLTNQFAVDPDENESPA